MFEACFTTELEKKETQTSFFLEQKKRQQKGREKHYKNNRMTIQLPSQEKRKYQNNF